MRTLCRSLESSRFRHSLTPSRRLTILTPSRLFLQTSNKSQRNHDVVTLAKPPASTVSQQNTKALSGRLAILQTIDDSESDDETGSNGEKDDYRSMTVVDLILKRQGWLLTFGIGLLLSAGVVEEFDSLISRHVELSFFVPLIMGHGGNTGSQATCSVIRALALDQLTFKDLSGTVAKELVAGALMGSVLGLGVLALALTTHAFTTEVAWVVAISLPLVSGWSNGLGAFLTLGSHKLNLDPAMTSAPLMTTIVDSTGLVIYFKIASVVLQSELLLGTIHDLSLSIAHIPAVMQ